MNANVLNQSAGVVDPWVVKVKKAFEPLPIGAYVARFTGVEEVKLPSGDDRWRWSWEVTAGDFKSRRADALTERSINANALGGRLVAGILRRPLQDGENVQEALTGRIGQTDLIQIAAGPKGGKPGVKFVSALPG